ncbi:reverse transcriptase domain-containing protein [Tanacetum coccineum]|uniref:Reverse transcriptase domain-containing protein n=1 Tax=Tanacetum coccineum TaxID=301880 RepID=A0ABQ5II01_9ASTR
MRTGDPEVVRRLFSNKRGTIIIPSIINTTISEGDTVCISSSGKGGCLSSTADRSKRKTMPSPVSEPEASGKLPSKCCGDRDIQQFIRYPECYKKPVPGRFPIPMRRKKKNYGEAEEEYFRMPEVPPEVDDTEVWTLFTDGAASLKGSGAGLVLIGPSGLEYTYALRLTFVSTNNEAEYEALLAGLRIARKMKVSKHRGEVDIKFGCYSNQLMHMKLPRSQYPSNATLNRSLRRCKPFGRRRGEMDDSHQQLLGSEGISPRRPKTKHGPCLPNKPVMIGVRSTFFKKGYLVRFEVCGSLYKQTINPGNPHGILWNSTNTRAVQESNAGNAITGHKAF